jgi:dihydrofolate reductase
MGKVIASITTSVDGYVTGPDDGPQYGLGHGMYDAAGGWGGTNPFPGTLFVLTHRTADQPPRQNGFRFIADRDVAFAQAVEAAGDGDVAIGGGADVIRQTLAAARVDELVISTAPVILGAGKRLFDGFDHDVDLEVAKVYSSPYATHVRYRVTR